MCSQALLSEISELDCFAGKAGENTLKNLAVVVAHALRAEFSGPHTPAIPLAKTYLALQSELECDEAPGSD
jgi:hypothetical protein